MFTKYDVITKPVFTEKSTQSREKGCYVFFVDRRANKIMITQAVKAIFKVDVEAVNIINIKPKVKRSRTRRKEGRTIFKKKALVFLKKGQKITELEV